MSTDRDADALALLDAAPERLEHRRFFNTGGDTCTLRELADAVRRLVPGARIDVRSAGERDLGGLAASVSDRSLEEELGVRRTFTPLEVGLRHHLERARARPASAETDAGSSGKRTPAGRVERPRPRGARRA